jgi:DNA-directed RNA polymerase subunit RPC12/RpoP
MSRDEFITATKDYNKHGSALLAILLLFVFVSLIAYAPVRPQFQRYLASKFSDGISNGLATVPILAPLILFFCFGVALNQRREKKFGVACPRCGKNLAGTLILRRIVIASRNCPYCGMKVLDEKP